MFVLAKALKYWAITTLGPRWTFRVLVLPSAPLVATGPYTFLRHPNYVAVVGELIGAALVLSAPVTGALALAAFGWLMLRRIAVEDRALGRLARSSRARRWRRLQARALRALAGARPFGLARRCLARSCGGRTAASCERERSPQRAGAAERLYEAAKPANLVTIYTGPTIP